MKTRASVKASVLTIDTKCFHGFSGHRFATQFQLPIRSRRVSFTFPFSPLCRCENSFSVQPQIPQAFPHQPLQPIGEAACHFAADSIGWPGTPTLMENSKLG
jgi:hypothetical protein